MNLDLEELLKEINKFKSNVTSSNSLASKLEESIAAIKDASKNTEREGTHYLSSVKETCDSIVEQCKKTITKTKDETQELITNIKSISQNISDKCAELLKESKELIESTKTKYNNIEKMMTDLSTNYEKYKKRLTGALIAIGTMSFISIIIGVLAIVL